MATSQTVAPHEQKAGPSQADPCPACSGQAPTDTTPASGRCAELCRCVATTVRRELAGPVAEFRGYLEALTAVHRGDAEPASTLLAEALAAVERVQEVATTLVANTDASHTLQVSDVDLADVAAAALAGLGDLPERRAARINWGPLPTVRADRGLLYHLFATLLRNAVTHGGTRGAPRVTVTSERLGGAWMVRVADDGQGMPPAVRERVFRLFDEDPDRDPGRGLGLATARRIVERHGGRLWIEDASGGGTAVCFILSAARP